MQPEPRFRLSISRLMALVCAVTLIAAGCSDTPTAEPAKPNAPQESPEQPENPSGDNEAGSWAKENYQVVPVAELDQPIDAVARAESSDLWVAERDGRVQRIAAAGPGEDSADDSDEESSTVTIALETELVLDISDRVSVEGEGGLLGIAFSPNGDKLYVSYTDSGGNSVISEFPMDGNVATDEERTIYTVEQPFSNHNGGKILFGPDDYLYIGFGDGGSGGDPLGHGQNPGTALGSVLRIDPAPSDGLPYTIPADNPFAEPPAEGAAPPDSSTNLPSDENPTTTKPNSTAPNSTAPNSTAPNPAQPNPEGALAEVWLWGVRNPWRFSFDSLTDDLWIGDVGQNRFEEVDLLPAASEGAGKGANLGWNAFEGAEPFEGAAEPEGHHRPLYTYETGSNQCSVVGGYVYRGRQIEGLEGVYLFSDFCSGKINGIELLNNGEFAVSPLTIDTELTNVTSFGQGPSGELYVLEANGKVSRLELPEGEGSGGVA